MSEKKAADIALSIKQPWAALLVHGVKAIEVRRWPTTQRGRILIHAARIPDERPQGWDLVTDDIKDTAELSGGIIGAATLTGCVTYQDLKTFLIDQKLHLNDPEWFEKPCLYGFIFTNPELLPFRCVVGNVRFFSVPVEEK